MYFVNVAMSSLRTPFRRRTRSVPRARATRNRLATLSQGPKPQAAKRLRPRKDVSLVFIDSDEESSVRDNRHRMAHSMSDNLQPSTSRSSNKPHTITRPEQSTNRRSIYFLSDSDDESSISTNVTPQVSSTSGNSIDSNDLYLNQILNKYGEGTSKTSPSIETPITTNVQSDSSTSQESNNFNDLLKYADALLESEEATPALTEEELQALSPISVKNITNESDSLVNNSPSIIDLTSMPTPTCSRIATIDLLTPDRNSSSTSQSTLLSQPTHSSQSTLPPQALFSSQPTLAQQQSILPTETSSPIKRFPDCPVCIESLAGKEVRATICGHIFCKPCILTTIARTKKCPNCRKFLTVKKIFPLYL